MNILPSPSVGVWECRSGSVEEEGVVCGQVCNYENINAQFLVIYIFINAHGHL